VFSSLYEGLVISIHALMKERGYEAFCENDTIPKNSMGMYSNFNEKAPETWSLHYKHPEKTNEVFVTCAMWGEKMLVVLDELAFGTPPNHFGPPMRHSIRRTQFGIQADKYKPVEESAEPESESVEDKIQSLSLNTESDQQACSTSDYNPSPAWNRIGNKQGLSKVFSECADPFLKAVLAATPAVLNEKEKEPANE